MDEKELWNQVKKNLINQTIDPILFNNYIKNAKIYSIIDNQCLIIVDSAFAKEILTKNLKDKIEKTIEKVYKKLSISFLEKSEIKKDKILQKKEYNQYNDSLKSYKNKYTFENFVKGNNNYQAYQSSWSIVHDLGNLWNPLFIYGDSGLGKTHLLHAIETQIIINYQQNIKVRYLSAQEFGKMFIEIYNSGIDAIEEFKNSFNEFDVLLIDDIQLLSKRHKTNEIFFHIFNTFIEQKKQIVITSDKYPDELNGFEQRMISRFQSGLSININPPDFETALNILNYKVKNLNQNSISFNTEVLEFIAKNFNSDVRKLEGALNRILFFAITNYEPEKEINLEDIKQIFKNVPIGRNEQITIKKIKLVVSDTYNIPLNSLTGKSRITNILNARHLSMYLIRLLLDEPFSRIGAEFGGKDHSTVMNAYKKIDKLIQKDKNFAKLVDDIKIKCQK